jgi:Fic/DOC family
METQTLLTRVAGDQVVLMRKVVRPPSVDMVSSFLPTVPTTQDLASLASIVDEQHRIIDARLHRTAKWRGEMRREVHGHVKPGDRSRYEAAYNELIAAASSSEWTIDTSWLRKIHAAAVGDGEFRKTRLTVGEHHNFPTPTEASSLIERALARAASKAEPIAIAATRLHLDVIAIHPFADGNGRTARLGASLMLARAGFRSSLLVAVEQHFLPEPLKYLDVLNQFQYGEIDDDACISQLMRGMVANAMYAAWFRARESRLRAYCEQVGLVGRALEQRLLAYDLEPEQTRRRAELAKIVEGRETPLYRLIPTLTSSERTEMAFQIGRLLEEEASGEMKT